jgi:putative acetyltransferase
MNLGEEPSVRALLEASFETRAEADLVEALRASNDMAGEMVLPLDDQIIGYYALSEMKSPQAWLCLAPVAIHPDHQGKGHGRRMLGQLSSWARHAGQYVVVLGDVAFYTRCGFDQKRAVRLTSPYPITHTLLAGPGSNVPQAVLTYPKPFATL